MCVCECVCEHPRVLPVTIIELRNSIDEKQHDLNKGMVYVSVRQRKNISFN